MNPIRLHGRLNLIIPVVLVMFFHQLFYIKLFRAINIPTSTEATTRPAITDKVLAWFTRTLYVEKGNNVLI